MCLFKLILFQKRHCFSTSLVWRMCSSRMYRLLKFIWIYLSEGLSSLLQLFNEMLGNSASYQERFLQTIKSIRRTFFEDRRKYVQIALHLKSVKFNSISSLTLLFSREETRLRGSASTGVVIPVTTRQSTLQTDRSPISSRIIEVV